MLPFPLVEPLLSMPTTLLRAPLAQKLLRQNVRSLAALTLALLCMMVLLSGYLTQRQLRGEAQYRADVLANDLLDLSGSGADLKNAQIMVMNAAAGRDVRAITFYDSNGRALVAWNATQQLIDARALPHAKLDQRAQTRIALTTLLAQAPLRHTNTLQGQVEIELSLWPAYRHMLLIFLWGIVLGGLTAALLAYRLTELQWRAMQPIFSLSALAEKVAEHGDYSVRADLESTPEMGRLPEHFNRILERIESWERDLHAEAHQRREAENRLSILNNHDNLTKLPNRHYFHRLLTNAVEDALAGDELMALMFIDISNFAQINEEYGYEAGDLVLTTLANRLCSALRGTDTLCRVDGDEFAAILPRAGSVEMVEQLAQRLLATLAQPIQLRGRKVVIGASIGAACCPLHAREQRLFLHNTDLALQAAKNEGRNQWRLFRSAYLNPTSKRIPVDAGPQQEA